MKKLLMAALLSSVLITTLFQPVTVGAVDRWSEELGEYENLLLMEEAAGQKITKVSTEPVDKETVDYGDDGYSVAVSASMDGKELVDLYSSDTTYVTKSGEKKYPAVLKADTNHTWTNNSCIIVKLEDVHAYIEAIQIDMGASKDGPRDYEIEYSVDEGVTWKAFSENGTDKGCVTSAGNIVTVFEKSLGSIDRDYTTKKCVFDIPDRGLYNLEYDLTMYDDIYFKISIDSDYKVDGTQGIIGSDKGEIAIYDIRLLGTVLVYEGDDQYEHAITPEEGSLDDSVFPGDREEPEPEKTPQESQPSTEPVTEEKQPDTGKTEVTGQPIIDWKYLGEYENLLLMEEAAGQKITKVSTEPVDKETVDLGDWGYSVAVSASMDGKELVDLYSSDTPYVTKSGEKKYPAVLKADTNHTWTNNSCIIVKLEDVHATMGAMQIDMGASKDGPRDYKIEYSVDEGVTWKAFSENGTDKGCITSAGNIVTVFEKSLRSIDRDYTTKECVWNEPAIGIYNYEYDLTMYDDLYFKISIDSDYKVDGTQGIIGSDKGEIAIYDIRLFAECVLPGGSLDDSVSLGQPEQPEPEKTTEESQPSTEPVTEEKQPDTGKTEVISQPIIDWKYLTEYENLLLMEEAAGQKITKVSTEPVDKETVDWYNAGVKHSVAISASMDGEETVDLYSSDTPYVTKSGEKKYPAVLKADTNHTWTNNSCIILKMEDVGAGVEAIQIDMGASKNGPRDYKIEYSVDEGVTWKAFSENGTDKGCITSAGNIITVFEKSLQSIDRDYTTKKCVWNEPACGIYNYEYDFKMHQDIYFKISIDSDYKVDGTQGIIGSDKGEIAIYDIQLYGPYDRPADDTEKTPQESQPSTEPVTEEKQPDTGKTEVISQPISVNQEQNIAPSNTGASGENAEQPKEKDLQTIRVKNTKKNYTVSQLKKRARSFVINISASGDPKVSFEKISGSKNLSLQKNTGKVIVKKGTKKGLYKMKVKIKVNETKEYQEKTVTKTITVRVK